MLRTFCLVCVSLSSLPLSAAPPAVPFSPNYIAVDDVALMNAAGKASGTIRKGELVTATSLPQTGAPNLEVRAQDGRSGRGPAKAFSRLGSTIPVTPAGRQAAAASNQFAFDLYQQVRQGEGNRFFSPASISTALAMTYAGAAGRTAQEMASVLHVQPNQSVHEGFASLVALLNSSGDQNGYTLSMANRLWGAANYRFEPAFLALTRDRYSAELQSLDFRQPERARQTINTWVEDLTRRRIVDLIPSGVLTPNTRLVLTNAIYFLGGWEHEFARGTTKQKPFHLSPEEKIDVLTMHQTREFAYGEDADVQVLALPYRGHELSMVIVLPKKMDGLDPLEERLTNERFVAWTGGMRERLAEVYLPRFKMRSQFQLSKTLQFLGMASAFSGDADFSAMSKDESLLISEVVHQAFVEVDEKGTEAAAATAVLLAPTSAPFRPEEPPKPIIFRADHPFLFFIRDNRTAAVLFMGRVTDPR